MRIDKRRKGRFVKAIASPALRVAIVCLLAIVSIACSPEQDSGPGVDLSPDERGNVDALVEGLGRGADPSYAAAEQLRRSAQGTEAERGLESHQTPNPNAVFESVFRNSIASMRVFESFHFNESRHRTVSPFERSGTSSSGVGFAYNALRKDIRVENGENIPSIEYVSTDVGEFLRFDPDEHWKRVDSDAVDQEFSIFLSLPGFRNHPLERIEAALGRVMWDREIGYAEEPGLAGGVETVHRTLTNQFCKGPYRINQLISMEVSATDSRIFSFEFRSQIASDHQTCCAGIVCLAILMNPGVEEFKITFDFAPVSDSEIPHFG